jgi:lysophospholipase L1-like esterase
VRVRALAFRLVALALGLGTGLVLAGGLGEAYFRYVRRHDFQDCKWSPDPELGFVNHVGPCRIRTAEFDVRYEHNRQGFHDDELTDPRRPVILALGDSHTWAVGVSKDEAWPNVLERLLANGPGQAPAVVNMGVPGYNLGQEYLLLRRYQHQLRPRAVVLAFSMATDAYDIRPPRYGGFVYGNEHPRTYFDLDGNGELILVPGGTAPPEQGSALKRLKAFLLERSQLYGAIRRSALAYYAVPLLRLVGVNAWPNMDGILARRLSPVDERSWRLIDKLLRRFREQLDAEGIPFTVVVLPYLPQVYDEVWDKAFAWEGGFDRFAGNRRLSLICEAAGIDCLDLTPEFVARVRATGRYLHFRVDAHANAEGHDLIGRRVFEHLRRRLEGDPASVRALGQGAGGDDARGGRVAPDP